MQRKLTEGEIEKLKQARSGIGDVLVPTYDDQGLYWAVVLGSLDDKIKHGTTDGKPYVDPEPAIPEGWRRAEADEWKRTDVKFWKSKDKIWLLRAKSGPFDEIKTGTRYIVPIDPPLTDEDACVWPRRLVMVRDGKHERWEGPFQYVGKDTASDCTLKYLVWGTDGYHEWYEQARRATPEEIEAAHGNS
jgi:hypothetical protein